ncbi:S8 family serine peptidase, partial [Methylomonas sp. SURF-1]
MRPLVNLAFTLIVIFNLNNSFGQPKVASISEEGIPPINMVGGDAPKYFSSILIYLGETNKALKLKVGVAHKSDGISQIMQRDLHLPNFGFTRELEEYLCKLNMHVCMVSNGKLDWKKLRASPPGVSEYDGECPNSELPSHVVCFPSVSISKGWTTVVRHLQPTDDLTKIVVENMQGCVKWDAKCAKRVIQLNSFRPQLTSRLPFDVQSDYELYKGLLDEKLWRGITGPIRFPARLYAIKPDFAESVRSPTDKLSLLKDAIKDAIAKHPLPAFPNDKPPPKEASYLYLNQTVGNFSSQSNTNATSPVEEPKLACENPQLPSDGNDPMDLTTVQKNALSAMTFQKFRDHQQLSELKSITVGVWDGLWDETHCEFALKNGKTEIPPSENRSFYRPANSIIRIADPKPNLSAEDRKYLRPYNSCNSTLPNADPNTKTIDCSKTTYYDHATFMAGLIGAQPNGVGIVGLNPKVRLWMYELVPDRLSGDPFGPAYADDDDDDIPPLVNKPPVVVNVSQATVVAADSFYAAITRIKSNSTYTDETLFVIASGNDGQFFSSSNEDVISRPPGLVNTASLSVRNRSGILTVVALSPSGENVLSCNDLLAIQKDESLRKANLTLEIPDICNKDPSDLPLSNYGDVFNVAAIGLGAGPKYGGRFGVKAGTSVATAYVTGLASLIRARLRNLKDETWKAHGGIPKGQTFIDEDLNTTRIVQERIQFTADPLGEGPHAPISRFGRINFDRALAFETDQIIGNQALESQVKNCQDQKGGMVLTDSLEGQRKLSIQFVDNSAQSTKEISLGSIRRLYQEKTDAPNPPVYTVIYQSENSQTNIPLQIIKHATFKNPPKLRFSCIRPIKRDWIGPEKQDLHIMVDLQDIRDFG